MPSRTAATRRIAALLLAAAPLTPVAPAQADQAAAPAEHVTFTGFDFDHRQPGGTYDGTARVVDPGGPGTSASHALELTDPTGTRSYTDPFAANPTPREYDAGTWTSPEVDTPFGLTELVASWNAHTPGGSWVETAVQGVAEDGFTSGWYVLGRWADDDTSFHPTSVPAQRDDHARVSIDTLVARNGHTFDHYRLRVTLLRPHGSSATPEVSLLGAMASNVPPRDPQAPASPTHMTRTTVLDVPTYSQELHRGDYPQYDNGGEAWCSPTSTSMVLSYWHSGPTPAEYSWVTTDHPGHPDPMVDNAARHTFDYNYDGAGNWPFNTAYAGRYGLESFVTRLRSLSEAEQFIEAGIPLVVSVSFKASELDGAGYSTGGHLMTIVGFTKDGDVVVNDPASHLKADDGAVRTTYDRAQFERVWVGHSGGVAYVIHPEDVRLPKPGPEANW